MKKPLAQYFDHTILKPDATSEAVIKICEEAKRYGFFAVCVNSCRVELVYKQLKASAVQVCSVVGFPLGASPSAIKAAETAQAVADGAGEIDMVINIGELKDENYESVEADIRAVVKAAQGKVVKVILETCMLSSEEIKKACLLSKSAGGHFVKTSTGFGGGGAVAEDVHLMRETVGETLQIKASGGIKTLADTLEMIEAGADRIGASAGVAILEEYIEQTTT